jgi:ABC-type Fe3+/spermidine/putrescine transport system ATPase subunit
LADGIWGIPVLETVAVITNQVTIWRDPLRGDTIIEDAGDPERQGSPSASPSASPADEVVLKLNGVCKAFGTVRAVNHVSLEMRRGEIMTLLGPSGCGKSTTLRLICGLEQADEGELIYEGRVLDSRRNRIFVPTHRRNMGMVFQSYAIWPHMTVFENVAYSLRVRSVRGPQLRQLVLNALDLVGLTGLEDRSSTHLSGGQQQRVAVARALVFEPSILLLDEPFSNLDAKLREQMRLEVRLLQKRLDIAVIFVTHDQIEALSLSDRVALMNQGVIQQVGSPRDVYERPANPFVRDFIGKAILLKGVVDASYANGQVAVRVGGSEECVVFGHWKEPVPAARGQAVHLCARPDDLELHTAEDSKVPAEVIPVVVEAALFTGERIEYRINSVTQGRFLVYGPRHRPIQEGQLGWLRLRSEGHTVWSSRDDLR